VQAWQHYAGVPAMLTEIVAWKRLQALQPYAVAPAVLTVIVAWELLQALQRYDVVPAVLTDIGAWKLLQASQHYAVVQAVLTGSWLGNHCRLCSAQPSCASGIRRRASRSASSNLRSVALALLCGG